MGIEVNTNGENRRDGKDRTKASSSRQKCVNKPDAFCYICGCYGLPRQRHNMGGGERSGGGEACPWFAGARV
ncbi:Hypothetical predicted protein [Podarcis lilfordi]|uniref:Uncharacterized protein n=1 Tax=Podarcis lilfordi TaxID=74358 RepID=A0AA35P6S5_9SAUR|nr:Hypothetical predicted protein [Podarcis lilfordi]